MPQSQEDPRDMSGLYNTALSPEEEAAYSAWAQKSGRTGDVYDYDLRGAWRAGLTKTDGHLPDTYKKPNHPTFSNESQYNGVDGAQGGSWMQNGQGRWIFTPGSTNLNYRTPTELMDYFLRVEPNAVIKFVDQAKVAKP